MRHPAEVSRGPRWHVLAVDHDTYFSPSMQMPQTLHAYEFHIFTLSMYPRGRQPEAIVRVRVAPPDFYVSGAVPAWVCAVEWNRTQLGPARVVAAPLPDRYKANRAVDSTRFCCFISAIGAVRNGQNAIRVTLVQPDSASAGRVTLDYPDVAWPEEFA